MIFCSIFNFEICVILVVGSRHDSAGWRQHMIYDNLFEMAYDFLFEMIYDHHFGKSRFYYAERSGTK